MVHDASCGAEAFLVRPSTAPLHLALRDRRSQVEEASYTSRQAIRRLAQVWAPAWRLVIEGGRPPARRPRRPTVPS
jgi:hypothetical protein